MSLSWSRSLIFRVLFIFWFYIVLVQVSVSQSQCCGLSLGLHVQSLVLGFGVQSLV